MFTRLQSVIQSDKCSERRESAERLRDLLDSDNVKERISDEMGHHGRSSQSSILSWDTLLHSVQVYVMKESDSILKLEHKTPNPSSQSAISQRLKNKDEIARTFSSLLKSANKCGHALNIADVLNHMISIWKHPKLQLWIGNNYCQLLMNEVFPYPRHVVNVTPQLWAKLQKIFIKFYKSPVKGLERSTISRLIYNLIHCNSLHCDLPASSWFIFFSEILKPAVSQMTSVEHLLNAFNLFSTSVAPNAQGRLCKIGEEIIHPLLQIWNRSSSSLKQQIIQFFLIQMCLHHPLGRAGQREGAWSHDDVLWKSDLTSLYDFILNELQVMSKRSIHVRDDNLKFVMFAAKVFHIVHSDNAAIFPSDSRNGWSVISDNLSCYYKSNSVILWLQLSCYLLNQSSITSSHSLPLLLQLLDLLNQVKTDELLYWVSVSLRYLAGHMTDHVTEQTRDLWNKVKLSAIRILMSEFSHQDLYQLLSVMIKLKLVDFNDAESEPWKLLCSATPTKFSLSFFISLAGQCKIPETCKWTSSNESYRLTMLRHLVPSYEDHETMVKWILSKKNDLKLSVMDMSHLLLSLVQPSSSSLSLIDLVGKERDSELNGHDPRWSQVEIIFLKSTFDISPLEDERSKVTTHHESKAITTECVIDVLCASLCQSFITQCTSLLQPVNFEALDKSIDKLTLLSVMVEYQAYLSCIIIHVMHYLDKISWSPPTITQLYQSAIELLQLISVNLSHPLWCNFDSNSYKNTVKSSVGHLSSILTHDKKMTLPDELIQNITIIANGKFHIWKRSLSIASSSTMSLTSNGRYNDGMDDAESDFIDSQVSNYSDASSTSVIRVKTSIVDSSLLSNRASCQLDACTLLVQLSLHDHQYWSTIESILHEGCGMDTVKSIQLVLSILSDIIEFHPVLNEEQVALIINLMSQLTSRHYLNSFLHERILVLLNDLIKSHDIQSQLQPVMRLVSMYWDSYGDGKLRAGLRIMLGDVLGTLVAIGNRHVTLSRKRKRSNTTNDNDDDDDDGESDILTLGKALMQLLIDPDHSVRIHTAATITNLFTLMPPSEQVKCFQELYDILQSSSQIESKLDELSREDESVNRVASGLCLWLCMGSASGSCEHHVMSVLVSAAGRGRVDKCLIKKVIRNMSNMLGYTSDIVLLKNTLSYTIIHWLHDNGPIEEFPYQLFGVDNINQFLIKYHNMIVPYLVHHCLPDAFHKLCHLTSISSENLVISSLPMSLVFIITDHINSSGNSHRNPSHDNKSYQFISSLISTRDITQCMKDTLPQFIVDLLSRLYESVNTDSCISQFFKSHDPLTTPPSYNSITIQQTLNFVAKNYFNEPAGNIIHVLIKKKDMIQTILLQLNLLVYGTHKLSDRKRFFMAYSLFVHLVSQELSTGLNGTAGYFILDVVHSVKRLLHHQSGNTADIDELFPLCCHTLRTVCEVAIDNCPELLAPHLHDIFNTLIPYTESHTTAVDLLRCIVQYGEIPVLRDVLVTLDPLPVTGTVSDVGNLLTRLKVTEGCVTLSKELLRFLSLDHHRPSVHGLMSLHKILKDNRYELYKLTQRQDDKGYNLVLQLMQALIDMVKGHGGGDGEVAIVTEVGKCLGEIGGMKMSLIAVPSARGVKVDGSCCATKIIKLLAKCLSDNDIDVVVASSQCIKSVLCTQNGCNALANIEQFDQSSSLWFKSLEPFKGSELNKDCNDVIIGQFESTIDVSLLWQQPSLDYPQGLKDLVLALLDSGSVTDKVVKLVKPVCQVKLQFCEDVFTLIIHDILKNESHPEYKIILSRQICQFISHAVSLPVVPIQYVNILLDVVMYLRSVPPNKMCSPWLGNFWLDLDFIDIARIALKCRSYFTSLLYIEIWYNHQLLSNNPVDVSECPHVKSLLLEVYRCIGEGDGYYGACVLYCPKEELTRRLNEHLQEWEELVTYGNWDATLHDTSYNPILAESYRRLGYFHLLSKYISNVDTSDDSNDEYMSYRSEMAWRCGIWRESKIELGTLSEDYHSNIQSLMAAVRDDNKTLFDTAMIKARSQVMDEILNINFESVCNISPHLTKLQGLLIFESVKDITDNNSLNSLLMDWREALSYTSDDFNINEFLLSLRVTVLHSLIQCYGDDQNKLTLLKPALVDMLMTISKLARRAKQYQIAKGSVIVLKHFTKIHSLPTWGTLLEEAKVYWYQGKGDIAMLLMKDLISTLQTMDCEVVCDVYPNALTIYGEWLMETLSENPQVILDEYLQKAVSLLQDQPSLKKDLQKAYFALARFHDGQYQRISHHMTSETYMTKRDILTRSKNDITNLSTQKVTTPSTKRQLQQLSKYSNEDESLMKQQENDKTMHLLGAVKNYISCLMETDQFNLRIFRLCSLWFSSNDDHNVNILIKEQLVCLPSYKLIPVVYQLAARLTTDSDAFQETLHQVLYTVCSDHPYHTLYVILALCNSGLDNEFPSKSYVTGQRNKRNSRNKSSPRTTLYTVDQDKVDAACGLLEHLRSASKSLASLIKDISCLCDSLVDLAYHDSSAHRNKKDPVVPIPSTCQLFKYKFDKVHIPTLDLPVSPTADYDSSKVTIVKYDSTFSLCGGINLPKVVTVRGSDGRRRRQLLKSRDDLRQDAVMEQVFDVMNVLLMKDPSTASRKLNIRTYKVIPLSQCSGIVEWCEGTLPLGTYLVGCNENTSEGAHSRYRPLDWKNNDCRRKISQCKTKNDKLKVFNEICQHFKPVFSHFFMENFLDPAMWFERRLAYTRSLATSSIVGYVMGLGDRHIQNILIDKQTAELVHIDLGVAFEQGRTLPTPEIVPFRLSRDLVCGMGVTGVTGVFQRSCEQTMTVMRLSKEELKMIVEVLVHDPLHLWRLTTTKARNVQRSSNADSTHLPHPLQPAEPTTNNKMAKRVLLRLQEKLEGIVDGVHLSNQGQIVHLIKEATDVNNLCMLFQGWQAWV